MVHVELTIQRRRLIILGGVLLAAVLLILGLVPVAASAQTATEEGAAIEGLQAALDGLDCVTDEGCIEDLAEVDEALAVMKRLFPDLGYFGLDGAIRWLTQDLDGHQHGPPTGADAVDQVQVVGAALVADAEAAPTGGMTTTTQATPTTSASTTSTSAGEAASGDTPTATLEAAAGGDSSSSGLPTAVWVVGGIGLLALVAWLIRMLMSRTGGE